MRTSYWCLQRPRSYQLQSVRIARRLIDPGGCCRSGADQVHVLVPIIMQHSACLRKKACIIASPRLHHSARS